MDFFAAQDHARRKTGQLIIFFAIAVLGIIGSVYLALTAALSFSEANEFAGPASLWDSTRFALTAVVIGGCILLGSFYKTFSLSRDGGAKIAEELGGRSIPRATQDALERRLINVVDEMAIASGMAAPAVFVLDAEQSINAFAAGSRPSDAIVAVTRGTLEQLTRDELQGVVGHEFSHILNGDMRLNLRLIGVLHGILLLTLAGRVILRSTRRSEKGSAPALAVGLTLIVIGYIGVLFGKLIKAAVSREREYLADAAAVQFTRNPGGIAGALRKFAGVGSAISHPRAEQASHLFFGSTASFSRLFATHPPIEERIQRIDPSTEPYESPFTHLSRNGEIPASHVSSRLPAAFVSGLGNFGPDQMRYAEAFLANLSPSLTAAIHQPASARAVILSLLVSRDASLSENQLAAIARTLGESSRDDVIAHTQLSTGVGPVERLPLIDLAIPALTELSPEARYQFLKVIDELILADDRTSIFEFVTRRLVRKALLPASRRRFMPISPTALKRDTALLLTMLSQAGARASTDAEAAFASATQIAPLDGPWSMDQDANRSTAEDLDSVLNHLAPCAPQFRKKVLESCTAAVMHDSKLTSTEGELLRAVCDALDCPAPPLV